MKSATPLSISADPAPSFLEAAPPADAGGGKLRGIAALAAASPLEEARNDVDYRWIECRSMLNRVDGRRAPFEWSINPYRGCEFGCAYCYARYTHEYMEHHDPLDFERIIYMKTEAARRVTADLAKGKVRSGETIAIGAATDPYQPAERRHEVTRSILGALARFRGLDIEIITKSDLILRDLDLLRELSGRHSLRINVSIMTARAKLARRLEPRTVVPARRFEALAKLREAGITAGVFLMPVLPYITDAEELMEEVVRSAAEAGASFLLHQVLFLTPATRRRFDVHLASEFPELTGRYRALYAVGTDAAEGYRREIAAKVKALGERHGMGHGYPAAGDARADRPAGEAKQLSWL